MILAGYLGGRYARETPLALTASLVFEQLYEHVEGDSAAMAELCALLSSLAEAPVRQALAVTGSVNQRGEIQAVGGVNEKIEGYFDVCRLGSGLSGEQGVIIPHANRHNLMLRRWVVEVVQGGAFHIYPVKSVDETITLLTGIEAGTPGDDGAFPEGSINGRVQRRLAQLARLAREHASPSRSCQ
jgi:predicted ATP-dependent protease